MIIFLIKLIIIILISTQYLGLTLNVGIQPTESVKTLVPKEATALFYQQTEL